MFEKVNTQNPGGGEEKQRRACPAPPAPGWRSDPGGPSAGVPRTRAPTGSRRPGRPAAATGDDPTRGDGRRAHPGPGAKPTASGAATLTAPRQPPPQRGPDGGPRHTPNSEAATGRRGKPQPAPPGSAGPKPEGGLRRRATGARPPKPRPTASSFTAARPGAWAPWRNKAGRSAGALADADACEPGPRAYRLSPARRAPCGPEHGASRRRRAAPAISREPGQPPEAAHTWQIQSRIESCARPWSRERSAAWRGRFHRASSRERLDLVAAALS